MISFSSQKSYEIELLFPFSGFSPTTYIFKGIATADILQLMFFMIMSPGVFEKPDYYLVLQVIQGNRFVNIYLTLTLAIHRLSKLYNLRLNPKFTKRR